VTDRTLDKPYPSRPKALFYYRSLARLISGESPRLKTMCPFIAVRDRGER